MEIVQSPYDVREESLRFLNEWPNYHKNRAVTDGLMSERFLKKYKSEDHYKIVEATGS